MYVCMYAFRSLRKRKERRFEPEVDDADVPGVASAEQVVDIDSSVDKYDMLLVFPSRPPRSEARQSGDGDSG